MTHRAAERIRVAEFFAGIGLMRIGLEQSNRFQVAWANDIEPDKAAMYRGHFRYDPEHDHFHLDDVREVHATHIPDGVQLATASFPCTDLSLAGDRAGLAGNESSMFWEFHRVLDELRTVDRLPAGVMLENVVVQGVGIDFYRSDERESDYQLFADGDDSGWRAFLQTPEGLVKYPGTFAVGGRVFVFSVPWSALGGKQTADVDMFIDWSKKDEPLNRAGSDRAPDGGRVALQPE